MKPSNTGFSDPSIKTGTGIDWMQHYDFDGPLARILHFIDGEDFADICEAAAQIAIAEYRKEAKAEWQRELAAKVWALPEYNLVDGRAWLAEDVLALLNENDQ